jgi:hypothetical protein
MAGDLPVPGNTDKSQMELPPVPHISQLIERGVTVLLRLSKNSGSMS